MAASPKTIILLSVADVAAPEGESMVPPAGKEAPCIVFDSHYAHADNVHATLDLVARTLLCEEPHSLGMVANTK